MGGEKKGRQCYSLSYYPLETFDLAGVDFRRKTAERYLRVPEVDLHDESHSDPCGKGEAGCDDDRQPISLAGAALCEGVLGSLVQRRQIVAGQVRCGGWEALKASRLQKQIWVWGGGGCVNIM